MKEFWNTIQFIFTAVGGWLGYYLGGCDGLLYALLAFVVADYVTGVMCAVSDKKLSSESELQEVVARAINDLLGGRDTFLPILQANILQVLENNSSGKIAEIDHRLVEQQQKLVKLANGKKDYNAVADEIHSLREQRQKVLAQDAEHDGQKKHIEELKAFLEEQKDIPIEYDEQLVRRLVEKVTVFDEKIAVKFKSGVEIEVDR